MAQEDVPKPLMALLAPLLGIPALLIVAFAIRTLFVGRALPPDQLAPLLGQPRVSTIFRAGQGDAGAVGPDAGMDLGPGGEVVIRWKQGLTSVQRGALLKAPDPAMGSFAVNGDGLVMAVRGRRLAYMRSGALTESFDLPAPDLRLERLGPDRMALYGKTGEKLWSVFALGKGGRYAKLFTFPFEISALAAADNGLIFASAGAIYHVAFGSRVLPLLHLSTAAPIRSLAYDGARKAVFFSTADAVYVFGRGRRRKILDKVSGTLRWEKDALFVLSDARQELLRIDGIFAK